MTMKIKLLSLGLVAIALIASGFMMSDGDNESIAIGTKAPKAEMKMQDISGKKLSLNDMKGDNGLVVIFSCNTCPFVIGGKDSEGWEGRYAGIVSECKKNNVGIVLVNSNAAKRDKGDSMKDMKKRAKEKGFDDAYYVLDKDSELANSFSAKTTPHVFMFDKSMTLAYKGAIDDNHESADKVGNPWLKNAINSISAGQEIDPNSTRPKGCSIKRVKTS
jgi:hypothetical protein